MLFMSATALKKLPCTEDFEELRNQNCYYVDKTLFLKNIFEITDAVMLFTRPRRFGKTLLMSMFEKFLSINRENPEDLSRPQRLFRDCAIIKDQSFCQQFMGRYPVISITLKDVYGNCYEDAYQMLTDLVFKTASKYQYLATSDVLSEIDKKSFALLTDETYLSKESNSKTVKTFLSTLCLLLQKHFKRQVILLIDEYDVPLAKAQYYGYHNKMITLISLFLGILKTPPKNEDGIVCLKKAVLTGCLKVAKNDIFTGVNNLDVNTVLTQDPRYSAMLGFTKEETNNFLRYYALSEYEQMVKENYDGYRIGDNEIYCPWDVVNFIDKNHIFITTEHKDKVCAGNYWSNSTSSSAVFDYIAHLSQSDNEKMQALIDGRSICISVNESMNYDCIDRHDSNDFWSLLLHTGYLTCANDDLIKHITSSDRAFFVKIPNLEIMDCFKENIRKRFQISLIGRDKKADSLACALLNGNIEKTLEILRPILKEFVSIRDNATRAIHENYYHGLLNGIFSKYTDIISDYRTNAESGDGYADISFKSAELDKAVVIEIKNGGKNDDLEDLCELAVAQIEQKGYAEPFISKKMVKSVHIYGIAFCGKNCFICGKKIK